MTPTAIHTSEPIPAAPPLASIISSQLLLTEKSSGGMAEQLFTEGIETMAIRATMEEFEGYSHFGLND
jgi:hypothetical protein